MKELNNLGSNYFQISTFIAKLFKKIRFFLIKENHMGRKKRKKELTTYFKNLMNCLTTRRRKHQYKKE